MSSIIFPKTCRATHYYRGVNRHHRRALLECPTDPMHPYAGFISTCRENYIYLRHIDRGAQRQRDARMFGLPIPTISQTGYLVI